MKLKEIDMESIKRNPEQPREHFDTDKLDELGESIKEVGLINPITVEQQGNKFEIIAGERRFRGNKRAKNKKIMALVKEYKSVGDKAVESLIENTHREDLNPFEKADFLIKIRELEGLDTDKALGERVGMSASAIYSALKYRKLDKRVVDKVRAHSLPARTAVELADLNRDEQRKMATKAQDMTLRETQKTVSIIKIAPEQVKEAMMDDDISVDEAENLMEIKDTHRQKKALDSIKQHKEEAKKYTNHLKDKKQPVKKIEKTKGEIISEALRELVRQLHTKTFDVGLQCDKMVDLLETIYDTEVTHNEITLRVIQHLKPEAKKDIRSCLNVMERRINNLLKIKEKIMGEM